MTPEWRTLVEKELMRNFLKSLGLCFLPWFPGRVCGDEGQAEGPRAQGICLAHGLGQSHFHCHIQLLQHHQE